MYEEREVQALNLSTQLQETVLEVKTFKRKKHKSSRTREMEVTWYTYIDLVQYFLPNGDELLSCGQGFWEHHKTKTRYCISISAT